MAKRVLTEREINIDAARVYLREAANRRRSPRFHATLMIWAANARRRASIKPAALDCDLFGQPLPAGERQP